MWFFPQPQVQTGDVFALNQRVSGTKKNNFYNLWINQTIITTVLWLSLLVSTGGDTKLRSIHLRYHWCRYVLSGFLVGVELFWTEPICIEFFWNWPLTGMVVRWSEAAVRNNPLQPHRKSNLGALTLLPLVLG